MTTTGAHQDAAGATARGWWWWGRRRSAVLDVTLGAVSALECAAEGVGFAENAGLPVPVGVLFGLVAGAVLVVRRRWPVAVVLVSIAITPAEMGYLMGIVGLYTLAASEVPRRIIAALAGMSLVAVLIVTFVRVRQDIASADFDPGPWYVPLMAVFMSLGLNAPPVLFGLYIGARRRLMESLRERADSLEQELSLLADRAEQRAQMARTEERTRIAREMHDVVAHRVSLMVVHAAALQAVALKDPQKAVRNAALVGDMGRQALTELREMLGVLRAGDGVPARGSVPLEAVGRAAAAAAGREVGAVEEGPCLDAVEELVEQSRQAGMAVELRVMGEARPCGAAVERTAYRVVQEGLTNVHKHAPGARVVVRLAHRDGEVAMQVENGPSDGGVADAGLPSGGNGLVGMRERVVALGGVFVSGPTDEGGFKVSAVLPVEVRGS
ncbi:sensor histidine kinase [Streptomyces sp. WAC05374]|uniref:sensor histidine kinase n=1 Tax=Streptomyces sp. WAC05374 TaxID=2487420 RepID=UPI0010544FC2|nr:histidine kinase [Streptomyces sp. WAC05374]TDF47032.1 sensor histidine kinase [Streptomyces sp. WAC05374]TDF57288.1 sensor histidine kinase [Streptomyces sp. WAC05374]TDF61392.1 sensor histidine kinase [Streptomyces sp. WAC05374]